MSHKRAGSQSKVVQKAERLLRPTINDSDDSDSPPRPIYTAGSPKKKILSNHTDNSLTVRPPSKSSRRQSLDKYASGGNSTTTRREPFQPRKNISYQENKENRRSNRSRSKSVSKKQSSNNQPSLDSMLQNVPWLKQRHIMKSKIQELEKCVDQQGSKISLLRKKHTSEKDEIKKLSQEVNAGKKRDVMLREMEELVQNMQKNEAHLIRELADQQKVSKEAISKMHDLHNDAQTEIDTIKNNFKDYYQHKLDEECQRYEIQIKNLEMERDQLVSSLKNLDTVQNLENTNKVISLSNQIVSLNSQLNDKTLENERLKNEIKELRRFSTGRENTQSDTQLKNLKETVEELNEKIKSLKTNELEISHRDLEEKIGMKQRIDSLVEEVEQKNKIIRDKDASYREQLEFISVKINGLQNELKRLSEFELKCEELQNELKKKDWELDQAKDYYKDKLSSRKTQQKNQKQEWAAIYGELLTEIRGLKAEIDALGSENRRLVTSISKSAYKDQILSEKVKMRDNSPISYEGRSYY